MNWQDRSEAQSKEEAIEALTDGIAKNVDPTELKSYASSWGIPLALQGYTKTASAQPATPATPVVDEDDDEDYYESSDQYEESYYESSY